ncbi:TetR/AcrR family transcriptional regulator [Mycolicibacterium sp. CBMA 234]|uniref:TetR/AcrR family transcriptional regulator n=1 Tax=Mycolicibacterium sp. CBMA 234 TaxID=1918495 RepID=UPI0012DF8843|nr:TetR/AcrR family transcriptional regulator [Mycolicibacterium sp. CBMA 234]
MATPHDSPGIARRRRPAEVRELLISAAERVVTRRGLSANAQEIAAEAGVHRSVLYRHFGTTEHLVRLAALRPFEDFLDKIQQMTGRSTDDGPTPLWDLMIGFLHDLLDILDEHRDFLMMAMSDSSPLEAAERAVLRREMDRILDDIASLARREGGARGLDPESSAVNTRLAITLVMGTTAYGGWLLPGRTGTENRDRLVADLANFILNGARLVPDEIKNADRESPRTI